LGVLVLLVGFVVMVGFVACDDGGGNGPGGVTRDPITYTGTANSVTYTLKIEDGGSRAVLTPTQGDRYTLTASGKTSTGTVSAFVGSVLTLTPSTQGVQPFFTVTVSGNSITAMTGSITWDNGTSENAPSTFTPSNPGGGGGNDNNIAQTYRGNYNRGSIWVSAESPNEPLNYFYPNDPDDFTVVVVGENTIAWFADFGVSGDYSGTFENVVTGGGGIFAPGGFAMAGGPWAYLYSSGAKIGIVYRMSINGELNFYTEKINTADFWNEGGGSLLGFSPMPVFSDIANEVVNVWGRYIPD